jgi:hypothetical protein
MPLRGTGERAWTLLGSRKNAKLEKMLAFPLGVRHMKATISGALVMMLFLGTFRWAVTPD